MRLSETELRKLIAAQPAGEDWPFAGGTEAEIEGHLKRIVAQLGRSALLEVEAEFGHYGSGYASYVHVFVYKKNRGSTRRRGDVDWIDGVAVYLCRLAPVAVYGAEQRTRGATGSSFEFLCAERLYEPPPGNWDQEVGEIEQKLRSFGLELPSKAELGTTLPFDARIPTILAEPPYRVFDALFYWED